MPEHSLHLLVDLILIGKEYPEVHKYLDQFQPFLQSNHRQYFHDMETVERLFNETGDPLLSLSAYLHITLDNLSDKYGHHRAVLELLTYYIFIL